MLLKVENLMIKTILYIEPIGGHGGMFPYDINLCTALGRAGADIVWATCDETSVDQDVNCTIWPIFKGIYGNELSIVRGLRYKKGLGNIIKFCENKQVIIHWNFLTIPVVDFLFFIKVKKKQKIRIVGTVHDVLSKDANILKKSLVSRIYNLTDHLVVHSNFGKRELTTLYGINPKKIKVIPHGHYLNERSKIPKVDAKSRLGIVENTKIILFFGNIRRNKGLDWLIKAMPYVVRNISNVQLLVVGRPQDVDFSEYKQLAKRLKVEQYLMSKTTFIPENEVGLYFSAADIVALPYIEITQSGVLLHALTYGKPVVASSVGGIPEWIEDGENGLLVPPMDPEQLGKAIYRIFTDEKLFVSLGRSAYESIVQRGNWDKIAQSFLDIYVQ